MTDAMAAIEEAIIEAAETAVTKAVEDHDFSDEVEKAVKDAAKDLDFTDEIETAAEEVCDRLVREMLPRAVKQALLEVLEDKDVLERLSTLLFERAN